MTTPRLASAGLPLLNRETADGWIHIVPKGELPNAEAGVTQVLDDAALDAILANLRGDAARLGNRWTGLYGGEEHFIYDAEKSSEAFWWGREFEKRDDGIWARGETTDIGEQALKNKRFKFTSFVADPSQPGAVEKLGEGRVRIRRIDSIGFTNFPNGKHLLAPISNRSLRDAPTLPDSPAAVPATDPTADNKKPSMKQIAQRLGLSADASEEAILGELTKLTNRADAAEGKLTPVTAERDLLKNRVTELLDEQIDADLATAGITDDAKIARLKPVLAPMKNRAERVDFLALLQSDERPAATAAQPLTNRAAAKTPAGKAGGGNDAAAEAKKAQLITNRAAQITRDMPGISSATAFITAQRAIEGEIATGLVTLK